MEYHSKIFNNLVREFQKLPTIGRKSAVRLALNLVNKDKVEIAILIEALMAVKDKLKRCSKCFSISDFDVCEICASPSRSSKQICIVENIRDLLAIEETQQFNGKYFVLNGLISPIEGIGPSDINLDGLFSRIQKEEIEEVIVAISPNFDGDTTVFYISKMLKDFDVVVSTLARGVSFGSELEYTDEVTLGRSLVARVPYQNIFKQSE